MPPLDRTPIEHERANASLDRLAVSLGCSTEDFFDQAPHELGRSLELLRLWLAIDDKQDRAKALSLLRNAKAKARALDEAGERTPGEPVGLAHAMQKPDRDL